MSLDSFANPLAQRDSFYHLTGGSLLVNSPSYVERQADRDLYELIQARECCYLFNSRQMGKSSLRVRVMERLTQDGVVCATIDPQVIGTQPDILQWYGSIISSLVDSFGLKDRFDLDAWWEEQERRKLSPVLCLSDFISKVVLTEISQPIAIFVEEIDSLRLLEFKGDDFFMLIRTFYERRAQEPKFNRLSFVLIGVTTPRDIIGTENRSPFNIGVAIEMSGFRLEEAQPLAKGLAGKVGDPQAVLGEVLKWTGGQPFLTQKLLDLVLQEVEANHPDLAANDLSLWLEQIVRNRIIENWEAQDEPEHLKTIKDRLLRSDERKRGRLLGLYQQICDRGSIEADESYEQLQLRLTGVVVKQEGHLQVYNRIYKEVFDREWVDRALADLRPEFYAAAFRAWQTAAEVDKKSFLLSGQPLRDAEVWAKEKQLSQKDDLFLRSSQELERKETARRIQIEQEEKAILESARQKAIRREEQAKKNAKLIGLVTIVIAVIISLSAAGWAGKQAELAQLAKQQAEGERDGAKKETEQAQAAKTQAETEKRRLDGKLKTAAKLIIESETKKKTAEDLAEKARLNLATSKQQLLVAEQNTDHAKAQTKQAEKNLVAAQKQEQQAKQQLSAAEQKTRTANAKAQNAEGRVRQAQTKLASAKAEIQAAVQKLKDANLQLKDANMKVAEANYGLAIIGSQKEALSSEADWLAGKDLAGLVKAIRAGRRLQQLPMLSQQSSEENRSANILATQQVLSALSHVYGIKERNILKSQGSIDSVNFSLDGQTFESYGDDGQFIRGGQNIIQLWKRDGTLIGYHPVYIGSYPEYLHRGNYPRNIHLGEDGTVNLWQSDSTSITIKTDQRPVISAMLSLDGQTLVSGGEDGTIKLWQRNSTPINTIKTGQGRVIIVNLSSDGQILVSGGEDGTIKLWQRNGTPINTIKTGQGRVIIVKVSSDGQTLVTGGEDGIIKLWKRDGTLIGTIKAEEPLVGRVDLSPDGQILVTGGEGGTIKLWKLDGVTSHITIKNSQDPFSSVHLGLGGLIMISVKENSTVKLWTSNNPLISRVETKQGKISSVTLSPNGQTLVTGGEDGTIKLWKLNGTPIKTPITIDSGQGSVLSVDFSPDGQTLASGGEYGTVKLWKLNGTPIKTLNEVNQRPNRRAIHSVNFSADGTKLVSSGEDPTIKLWKSNGDHIDDFFSDQRSVHSVDFSPDGQTLVSVSTDDARTVKLWKLNGTPITTLNTKGVNSAGFSPDSQTLVTGGEDGTVKFWTLDGTPLATLQTEQSSVYSVKFSPDGQTLLTSGSNGTVKLWHWNLKELIKLSCNWANDYIRTSPDVTKKDHALCNIRPRK